MSSRIRTVLAIVLAALVAAPAGAGAGRGDACRTRTPDLPVRERVADLLSRMTLEEKVGQMTQTERYQVFDDETPITTWELGSILSGGGSTPTQNTPEAWADMIDRFQRAALRTRLGIPLLYGIDAVHGNGNALGATVFPHNIGLGATRDPKLVRKIAEITAEETRASGPQWTFSPVRLRRPRRPLGPDVRELQRGPGPRDPHGDRDRRLPGPARGSGRPRPRARHREALRRRRRHRVRHRQWRLQDRPGRSRSPIARTSGTCRCGSTCRPCASTTWAA